MDEGPSRAVVKVFVELHREGLIYKDKRLVNWDTKLLTAISDLEVQQIEVKSSLWHLRYPIEGKTFNPDDASTFIVVATARPETMLGDTAVAVHPDNDRLGHLIGQHVILPLVGRRIPIIGDDYADPEKGSGAVKITPAHDFNDFEVGKRHGLPQISVFDQEGISRSRRQRGLFARSSRMRVSARGRIEQSRPLRRAQADRRAAGRFRLPRKDRAEHAYGAACVPLRHRHRALSDRPVVCRRQTMAQPAIAAVRSGATTFVPKNWEKPISSGWRTSSLVHLAPTSGGAIRSRPGTDPMARCSSPRPKRKPSATLGYYVEQEVITPEQGREMAEDPSKREGFITRDEDVLDTWFSSGLAVLDARLAR